MREKGGMRGEGALYVYPRTPSHLFTLTCVSAVPDAQF